MATERQYSNFGASVAGLLDIHVMGGVEDSTTLELIKIMAETYHMDIGA